MASRMSVGEDFAGVPAAAMKIFLRRIRAFETVSPWRFSLSDLSSDDEMEMLTAAEAAGFIAAAEGPGVYKVTSRGQSFAAL